MGCCSLPLILLLAPCCLQAEFFSCWSSLWPHLSFPGTQFLTPCSILFLPIAFPPCRHLGSQPRLRVPYPHCCGELPARCPALSPVLRPSHCLLSWARPLDQTGREAAIPSAFFLSPPLSLVGKVPHGPGSWVSKYFISTGLCCPWQGLAESAVLGAEMRDERPGRPGDRGSLKHMCISKRSRLHFLPEPLPLQNSA